MSLPPFGSEEFQAKIAKLWPNQVRPNGTLETIKALFDEVGEEIVDAIAWYIKSSSEYEGIDTTIEYNMKSPQNFLAMKQLILKSKSSKWAYWMSQTIMDEYHSALELGRSYSPDDMQA